jgi:hypothetical protein
MRAAIFFLIFFTFDIDHRLYNVVAEALLLVLVESDDLTHAHKQTQTYILPQLYAYIYIYL